MKNALVSIGVPVYNGAPTLRRALDCLLDQDYPNIEIVISDNASEDATAALCEEYASRDSRVKYHRADTNHGAAWNFNRVFQLSSGKYFMWAAHDDRREPRFVTACVAELERSEDAVLCQARTAMFIEGRDEMLCIAHLNSFEGVTGLAERYRATLKHFPATAIYGVYRSSALRRTQLLRKHISADVAFIQELSIYGRFIQVTDVLFHYVGRVRWNTVHQDYKAVFGVDRKPWWYLPFVVLFWSNWRGVAESPLTWHAKLRLWGVLLRHEVQQVALKISIKIARRVCPDSTKERLGCIIYWRWMHNINVEVSSPQFFTERVIKPKLGWWG